MKTLNKLLAAVGLSFTIAASPAHAWGAREQAATAGIASVLLYQQITQPRVYVQPPPQPVVPYYPGTVYPDYIYRPMYKAVDVFVPECQCYRTILVQVN